MFAISPLQYVSHPVYEEMKRQVSWGQHDILLTHNILEFLCSVVLLFVFIHYSFNTCQSHPVGSLRNDLNNLKAHCFSFSDLYSNKNVKQYCDITVISPMVCIRLSDAKLGFSKKV